MPIQGKKLLKTKYDMGLDQFKNGGKASSGRKGGAGSQTKKDTGSN